MYSKYLGEKLIISTLVCCVSNAQSQSRLSTISLRLMLLLLLLCDLGGWRGRYNMIAAIERTAVLVIVVVKVTDMVALWVLPHQCGWGFRRSSLHHGPSSPSARCTSSLAQRNPSLGQRKYGVEWLRTEAQYSCTGDTALIVVHVRWYNPLFYPYTVFSFKAFSKGADPLRATTAHQWTRS